jgi:hypothetical protein
VAAVVKHLETEDLRRHIKYLSTQLEKEGVRVHLYMLRGRHMIPTRDWGPNAAIVEAFKGIVPEIHVIGSCREPGLTVNAVKDGALAGCAV